MASTIFNLNANDFFITGGGKTTTLRIRPEGPVLVLFKMDRCAGCAQFEPVFHQLAHEIRSIQYAIANVSGPNRNIVHMSKGSSTELKFTPHLILYANGRPAARFTGNLNKESVQNFINRAMAQVMEQGWLNNRPSTFMPSGPSGAPSYRGAPSEAAWGTSHPPPDHSSGMAGGGGGMNSGYMTLGNGEESEEEQLLTPNAVIPHNRPWQGSLYKAMG